MIDLYSNTIEKGKRYIAQLEHQVNEGTARQSDAVQLPNMREIIAYREAMEASTEGLQAIIFKGLDREAEKARLFAFRNHNPDYLEYMGRKQRLIDKGIFKNRFNA